MIKLVKIAEPTILTKNSARWTKVFLAKLKANKPLTLSEKTRYRHPAVKKALIAETYGKCAYCEAKILHIHHGDVEHIHPKSSNPSDIFSWLNLTLACEMCNQNKSDKDPTLQYIIDPYNIDPEDHLVFVGAFIFHKGTTLGISTKHILELHRADLFERRTQQLEGIMSIYSQIFRQDLPMVARKAIYKDLVQKETAPSAQFAAMNRALVRQMEALIPETIR